MALSLLAFNAELLAGTVLRDTNVDRTGCLSGNCHSQRISVVTPAGHAAALGRPLGAVPGPVTSASSAGCHRLLREYDARCVTTTAEIRELWGDGPPGTSPGRGTDPDQSRVLDAMSSRDARAAAELSRRSGLAPERVNALLGLLELEGAVRRVEGGWQRARVSERRG
ncbi:hypothetical protein LJR205_003096 [Microbacterium foliorum]